MDALKKMKSISMTWAVCHSLTFPLGRECARAERVANRAWKQTEEPETHEQAAGASPVF